MENENENETSDYNTNEHDVGLGRWEAVKTLGGYVVAAVCFLSFVWILATHGRLRLDECRNACLPRAVVEVTPDRCVCVEAP